MENIHEKDQGVRPYDYFFKVMGGKWKSFIIRGIAYKGYVRFNELIRILGVSPKVLQQQLRELERDGIIKRIVYSVVPPRVDYVFTEDGEKLVPIYDLIYEWAVDRLKKENIDIAPYTFLYHNQEEEFHEIQQKKNQKNDSSYMSGHGDVS